MKVLSSKKGIVLGLALLTATVGCGSQASQQTAATATPAAIQTPAPVATATPEASKAPQFTVDEKAASELMAQFGSDMPTKVVSASVAMAEILNELDVKPIGVPTSTIALPDGLKDVAKIGSALKPDVEQITKLQPDIIVGPVSIKDSLEKIFKPASLKTAYLPSDSLEDLKLATVVMSRVFKQEQKAVDLFARLDQQEQAAVQLSKDKPAPKVMFLFGSAESFMLMNENTFPGSIAKKLGASNVVSDVLKSKETYIALNMENVVSANPDVIMLVSHGDPDTAIKKFEEEVKKNGAWDKLNAFKNNKVVALDYNLFGVASIVKAPDAYAEMAQKLYQ
ncbi:ferrichrome ABC transporter substrate-binding protein [Paenibacillus albiflavus]|uniref:Ferrichrome ABC transporter substrate-binding protein n=1 Tax=Paenibacillus albiflavus TaxID=2545760 RepID=A0A4R4EQW2_9BACL|nr:ABC transporter substrate-binding protein [Paenibacillus albiflavus]TCZ80905.1 ferrichrome ABC transporter substrate-binding protein [Paenibacillus albiflavus]